MLFHSRADVASQFSNSINSSDEAFRGAEIFGHAAANVSGCITSAQVRAILPLPWILSVIDAVLEARISTALVGDSFFETPKEKRQVLDLVWPLGMVLEKGNDLAGNSSMVQADIKAFYHNIRAVEAYRWLLELPAVAVCALQRPLS